MDSKDKLHIVISPEGQLAITDRWKKGFYYMAVNAKVPIVMTYLDFQKKRNWGKRYYRRNYKF